MVPTNKGIKMENFLDSSVNLEAVLSIQVLDMALLTAAAQGKIDLNALAKQELANRGLDAEGKWVGFKK